MQNFMKIGSELTEEASKCIHCGYNEFNVNLPIGLLNIILIPALI